MYSPEEVRFPIADTERFERDLQVAKEVVVRARGLVGGTVLGGMRGFPAVRLRRRSGLRTTELRIMLNPQYLRDGVVHYEVRLVRWLGPDACPLGRPTSALVGRVGPDGVRDHEALARLVESALDLESGSLSDEGHTAATCA